MFARLWLRSLTVKRPQALLALAALLVGATIASTLLNLYGDVRHKMTEEFRAYGPNIIIAPAPTPAASGELAWTMEEGVLKRVESLGRNAKGFAAAPLLYAVVRAVPVTGAGAAALGPQNLVAAGTDFTSFRALNPAWRVQGPGGGLPGGTCAVGTNLAARLGVKAGDEIELRRFDSSGPETEVRSLPPDTKPPVSAPQPAVDRARVVSVVSTGGAEDDQVFLPLSSLQQLAGLEGRISLVELSVSADTASVENAVREFSGALPGLEVRPVRQIVESEGRVLGTILGLLAWLTALILAIVILCVMATVTVIVLERRKDVAVMKALGASDRQVTQLLLSEIAALGLAGGLLGCGIGILLARELGLRLFGVTLEPDWPAVALICLASALAAVLSTLAPVGSVRSVEPAEVLRGE